MEPTTFAAAFGLALLLASSCGLRAFLAPFFLSAAAYEGYVSLPAELAWMGSPLAVATFSLAIILEVVADKVPLIDHSFDALHVVIKPVLGALAGVAIVGPDAPVVGAVAAMAGGGLLAGGAHLAKASVRVGSTATTLGSGNWVLSLLEDGLALALAGGVTAAAAWYQG